MEDQEKNIQDAQINEADGVDKKMKTKNYHTEIILIFIIGLLVGIMIKAESLKKISIGFSDYRVTGGSQEYKLDKIEQELMEKIEKEQEEAAQAPSEDGAPQVSE